MGFGKDGKGVIITETRTQALAALGAGAGILLGTKLAMTTDFRMLKVLVNCIVTSLTTGEGEGLLFGIADGDLTIAEIEEALENQGPLSVGDGPESDQAMRPQWIIGGISGQVADSHAMFVDAINGGPTMVHKVAWTYMNVKSWNYFIYNLGDTLTTGSSARLLAKSFGVWVR